MPIEQSLYERLRGAYAIAAVINMGLGSYVAKD
jgi:hypothetical protein